MKPEGLFNGSAAAFRTGAALNAAPIPPGNHFFFCLFVWSEISSHIIQSDRVKARSFIPGLTWDAEYRGRSGRGRCDRWRRCWSRSPGTPGPPGRRPSLETVCPAHRYLQQTEAPMSRAALPSLVGDSKSNRGLEWSGSDSWSPEDQKSKYKLQKTFV